MRYARLVNHIRFQFLLFPFAAALALFTVPYGCKQGRQPEQQAQTSTITLENLQTAYAKSLKHNAMYERFAKRAEKDHLLPVANLYRAIARSEGIHAANHAQLMRTHAVEPKMPVIDSVSVGTTLQTLKMSLSSEEIEIESMYSNLIRTAELEKVTDAVDQFEKTKSADARQMELLKEASDKQGKIPKVPYFVCVGCGYIFTSPETEECPVCHAKKSTFEKI